MAADEIEGFVIRISASKRADADEKWQVPAWVSAFEPHAATDKVRWSPDFKRATVFQDRAMADAVVRLLLAEEHVAEVLPASADPCAGCAPT